MTLPRIIKEMEDYFFCESYKKQNGFVGKQVIKNLFKHLIKSELKSMFVLLTAK